MKIYACAIMAKKITAISTTMKYDVDGMAIAMIRSSKEQAIGTAYTYSLEQYPIDEGYTSHSVSVCEVPMDMVAEVYTTNDIGKIDND